MKKLLLTVAVTSLALSSTNAFANRGNGGKGEGKGRETRTQEEMAREALKGKQAPSAGSSAARDAQVNAAMEIVTKSGLNISGKDARTASENIVEAMKDAEVKSTIETLVKNSSSNEVAQKSLEIVVEAARQGLLASKDGQGILTFLKLEIATTLNGKSTWPADALAKLNTTLGEVAAALKSAANAGQSISLLGALRAGLEKVGFSKERIDEILKQCFKIG